MKRETQKKGDIGKAQAIARFTKMGYDVAILITESAPYDLIIDTPEGLKRVQVKYSKNIDIDLRHIHSNARGYVIRYDDKNAYDWLYVFMTNGKEYLIKKCIIGQSYIRMIDKYLIK